MNFRFLNIPVRIHPDFWIFFIFFTNLFREPSIYSLILGGVLIISLLVHEYGHALTALMFGANPRINLMAFGGNAEYNNLRLTAKQELLITINGPLLESLLIFVSYFLLQSQVITNHYVLFFLHATMKLNIYWCLLNLIPVIPLDGGHILVYLLEDKFEEKGVKIAMGISFVTALIVAPYLFINQMFFFAVLLLVFAFRNLQGMQRIGTVTKRASPSKQYQIGIDLLKNQHVEKGKAILRKLLKSKDMKVKNSAKESLAKLYFEEEEIEKSYQLLLNADHDFLKEGKCLLCKLALIQKNYEIIDRYSREIYAIEPTFDIALLNSKAFAYLNKPEHAGAWLETASKFGEEYSEKVKELIYSEPFDRIKEHRLFKKYVSKI